MAKPSSPEATCVTVPVSPRSATKLTPLDSAVKTLRAYARLKTAPHLTLRIERGGKNVSLDYSIR